jgi:hypothetical protein
MFERHLPVRPHRPIETDRGRGCKHPRDGERRYGER